MYTGREAEKDPLEHLLEVHTRKMFQQCIYDLVWIEATLSDSSARKSNFL